MTICRNCGRSDCPTLTAPHLPPTYSAIVDRNGKQTEMEPGRSIRRQREDALVDCCAHAVDWFARCQQLQAFAAVVFKAHRDELTDVDGGTIHDAAMAAGLLHEVPVMEACGEGCRCADYYSDFPTVCVRPTALGKILLDAD